MFTIFLVPPLIHTKKTYTNLTLCIVIHILFYTSLIINDSRRTTKHYHIKQQYTAIPALLTLITPLIGRINTSARSQHTSRDRIDPHRTRGGIEISGDAATLAAASAYQAIAIRPVNLHNDPTTTSDPTPASYHKRYKNTVKKR